MGWADLDDHRQDDQELEGGRGDGEDGADSGTGADAGQIQEAEKDDHRDARGHQCRLQSREDDAEVDDPRGGAEGRGQEIVDQDQQAADQAGHRADGVARHRHHPAALRVAHRNLAVFVGEQDENEHRHEDKEGGVGPDLAVKDAGRVIDGGSEVGEDDGPAEEPAQPPRAGPGRLRVPHPPNAKKGSAKSSAADRPGCHAIDF